MKNTLPVTEHLMWALTWIMIMFSISVPSFLIGAGLTIFFFGEAPARFSVVLPPPPEQDSNTDAVTHTRQSAPPSPVPRTPPPSPTPGGAAARIGTPDTPAWLRHAAALPTASDHMPAVSNAPPLVAIVIDDLGLNPHTLKRLLTLPAPLTLAFLPYAANVKDQTARARQHGHEIIVHMPMQPQDSRKNPGPNALTTEESRRDLSVRLDWALSRFDNYVGMNNHMGSAFTAHAPGMEMVMEALAARGLLFLDSATTSQSVGPQTARAAGVPYARRTLFLDHDRDSEAIRHQLARLEDIAHRQGHAIAIGHPHSNTLEALAQWLPTLERKGITLASLAHIVLRGQTGKAHPDTAHSDTGQPDATMSALLRPDGPFH